MTNEIFFAEITKSIDNDKLTFPACREIISMAKIYVNRYFSKLEPDTKEELIAVALMDCSRFFKKFDTKKETHCISFFLQIIKSSLVGYYHSELKRQKS